MERDSCENLGCDLCHTEVKEVWRGKCSRVPDEFSSYWKFPSLNPIQTMAMELYDKVGNPSFVACSGTGTGKTVIAERAIVEQKKSGRKGKIVYLSPLKALATEKMSDWKDKFGLDVVEMTGDTKTVSGRELDAELMKHDVILTSYEMFNSWSRKPMIYSFLNHIDILIIDEIHNLGSLSRGGELDGAITRFLMYRDNDSVQLVFLSATFDNVVELKDYCEQYVKKFEVIDLDFSPIVKHIEPTDTYHSFRGANEEKLFELLCKAYEAHSDGGVLGLMYSRKGVEAVAHNLNKKYGEHTARAHNAGMNRQQRQLTEIGFRAGEFKILVASPTIAMGLNLPGQSIAVIADFWDAHNKEKAVIPKGDYMQIIGRAGRPPFYKDAFIYTAVEDKLIEDFEDEQAKQMLVAGKLLAVLDSVINAEVFKSPGISAKGLFEWLKQTYSFYSNDIPEDELNAGFKEEIMWLIDNKFVTINEKAELRVTPRGRSCAISMHRPRFIKHVFNVVYNADFIESLPSNEWRDEHMVTLLADIYDCEYSNVQVTGLDEDAMKLMSFDWIKKRDGEIMWGAHAPEYAFIREIREDLSRLTFMVSQCGIPRTSKHFGAIKSLDTAFSKGGIPLELVRLSEALKGKGVSGVGIKRLFVLYCNGVRADSIGNGGIPRNLILPRTFRANQFLRGFEPQGEVTDYNKIDKIYPSDMWGKHRERLVR